MRRSWRWMAGYAFATLLLLAVLLIIVLGWRSPREHYLNVEIEPVAVPRGDRSAIERGRYLVHAVAVCGVCHGTDLAGQVMSDSVLFGYVRTPNLTPGRNGVGSYYRAADWVRAIRHGLGVNGRALAFMPVDHYQYLTDADLGAMIAYLQSLAPVDNEGAVVRLNVLTRAIINSGLAGDLVRARIIVHEGPRPRAPADRGAYLALVGGCDFCHGPDLGGGQGPEPGAPPGPDITGRGPLADWTLEQFNALMREGRKGDGTIIDPRFMPWRNGYQHLSDEDLLILFRYLLALPRAGASASAQR